MIPRIDLSDLRIITNDFSDTHKIGRGGYGEVYKAVYNKEEIAVRLLDSALEINNKQFMDGLSNHMKVQHPNIVRLVGYCNEVTSEYIEQKDGPPVFGKHIYKVLCFEYMHGTSLDKHLSGNSLGHDWPTHYQIIKGTCAGLCYLHCGCERPILHLDLRPANILLDKRKNPKIADFGLSRIYTASRTHVKVIGSVSGTTNYMAPELRKEGVVSDKADVFSLGVTIIDVIGGSDGLELYRKHGAKKFVEYVRIYWRERDTTADLYQVETCTKIAIRCVHTERQQRPTMKEIMVNLNDMETQVLGKGFRALTVNSSSGKFSSLHVRDTLAADAYNHILHSTAANSPGGKIHTTTVQERPNLSAPSSKLQSELLDVHKIKLPFPLEPKNLMPVVLNLQLLKAITSDFSVMSELGRGGYGVVYKGVFPSGESIAVKKLEAHIVKEETFKSEVSSLSGMKHQNVVQIIGYCAETSLEWIRQPSGKFIWVDSPNRMICLEYVCNGSLQKYISDETMGLEWNMRYDIIKGICNGLHFLHEKCSIVHLDLKPENILMDAAMVPKIADFGLSRMFGDQETRLVTKNRAGTLGYMALEYTIQGLITPKADIFSLGVIIIQIVTGHKEYPLSAYFQSVNENDCPQSSDTSFHDFMQEVLGRWRKKFMSMPNHESMEKYTQQVKQCITIALKCVDRDMKKRPTAKDIIHWLTAADQDDLSQTHLSDSECSPSELSGGNEDI